MADKRPAFKENIHRLFDEASQTDLAPGIVSLIESELRDNEIELVGGVGAPVAAGTAPRGTSEGALL